MNCVRLRQVVDAWLDGELDADTGDDIGRHLASCPACAALKEERDALSRRVREHAPRYRAPARLAATVRRSIGTPAGPQAPRGLAWPRAWAAIAATAVISAAVGFWLGHPMPEDSLREQVVASHVASLAPSRRLIEVASSDRHAVKPWFQGKVDFAPAVRDLSSEGFVLLGGRLDHVADAQAAAIVYRLREHVINLFVWRAPAAADEPLVLTAARGFSLATWSEGGLRFAAVSDTDSREMERFARLLRSGQ